MTTFFQHKSKHPLSSSEVQRNALQSLRDDSSIVISKPDKENVVIINKSDYHSKMLHILHDKTKFSCVKSDNNLSNLSRFQRFLRRLKSKKLLEEDDYRRIYPSAISLPAMYGLPKIHKPSVPLRPILSATGSCNQECAKCLTKFWFPSRASDESQRFIHLRQ